MTTELNKHMKQLKPHPHAALIREWAEHLASGAIDAGWYEAWTISGHTNHRWAQIDAHMPRWCIYSSYKIVMTSKHPDYKPPTKKIVIEVELTDSEVKEVADGCRGGSREGMRKLSIAFSKAIEESK